MDMTVEPRECKGGAHDINEFGNRWCDENGLLIECELCNETGIRDVCTVDCGPHMRFTGTVRGAFWAWHNWVLTGVVSEVEWL